MTDIFLLLKPVLIILWNLKVHNSLPLVHILSQMSPFHILPLHSFKIHLVLSSHSYPGVPNGLLHSGFPTAILYEFLISLIRAKCSVNLILLDLISPFIFSKEYKLWSFLLCPYNLSTLL